MKIFILLLILALIIYIGLQIRAYYRKRERILNDILSFCNIFENEVKFSKNAISKIVQDNLNKFDKELSDVLEAYFVHGTEKACKYLNKKEQEFLDKFMQSLGKADEEGEIRNLNNYRTEFLRIKEDGQQDCKKYGSFALKMSIVIGLLVVIVLI